VAFTSQVNNGVDAQFFERFEALSVRLAAAIQKIVDLAEVGDAVDAHVRREGGWVPGQRGVAAGATRASEREKGQEQRREVTNEGHQ
jgi:hypothetical protein